MSYEYDLYMGSACEPVATSTAQPIVERMKGTHTRVKIEDEEVRFIPPETSFYIKRRTV